ncbi:O-acyltransferase WSD1-like [Dendrobium catenatum]|uniref:O-acyltransferase WSD1-like n=1 Tax=Dendrobium catenatum TaxID=906689 RepID=UPI0010A05EA1|nr:O-acyltransferase WSD1-like [Dendrobium catenatum]
MSFIPKVADNSWRQKLRWVPTKVNLDEHIVLADPGPKSAEAARDPNVGDLYVENYTAGLCSSQLDYSRPPWEVHILPIRTSEAACVAVFHLNHSMGDGTSLMSLLHACTHRTSDPESLPSLPKTRRHPTPVAANFGPFIFLCWIWNFLIYLWNTLIEVILLVSTPIYLKDTKILNMGKEGIEYRPRRIVHRTLCLDDIITIKNTIGCTINDVLVGATSAALSRYLSRKYGGLLPKQLLIRAALVVNILRISGINDLSYMMKEGSEAKWGNRIGHFLLRLPVLKCEDPLDYARNPLTMQVQSYLNKIKVVVQVDEQAIPDPHRFLDDITHSVQIMKGAAASLIPSSRNLQKVPIVLSSS